MATNYVADGCTATVAAPYALTSGDGALVGSLFGVAHADAANGAEVVLGLTGEYTLAKISAQAWTVGARIYWDDSNTECTTASSGNKLIGVAMAVAANPSDTGRVRLNGSFTQ